MYISYIYIKKHLYKMIINTITFITCMMIMIHSVCQYLYIVYWNQLIYKYSDKKRYFTNTIYTIKNEINIDR